MLEHKLVLKVPVEDYIKLMEYLQEKTKVVILEEGFIDSMTHKEPKVHGMRERSE